MRLTIFATSLILANSVAFADTCNTYVVDSTPVSNITQGLTPMLHGTYGVGGWDTSTTPAIATSLTDNSLFLEAQKEGVSSVTDQPWDAHTVWWNATSSGSENNEITIDLDGHYLISNIIIQADTNDNYSVEYDSNGSWANAWTAAPSGTWGMVMRKSADLTPNQMVTDKIRVKASGGDSMYAISEIAVFGRPVTCIN